VQGYYLQEDSEGDYYLGNGEIIETDKTAKEQRQKKTPDSLERDSGENEANNTR
jgi:hypothetical protein